MQILNSWLTSLKVCLTPNLKVFGAVCGLSVIRTYRAWLALWWPLVGIFGVFSYLHGATFVTFWTEWTALTVHTLFGFPFLLPAFTLRNSMGYYAVITYMVLLYTLYKAARPSVGLKNFDYFVGNLWHIGHFAVWFLVVRLFSFALFGVQIGWQFLYDAYGRLAYLFALLSVPVLVPVLAVLVWVPSLYMFFMLDSDGRILSALRASWRATKLAFFNAPGLLVLCSLMAGIMLGISWGIVTLFAWTGMNGTMLSGITNFAYLVLLPIMVGFAACVYIKFLYQNSARYLG